MKRHKLVALTIMLSFVPNTYAVEKAPMPVDLIELLGELDEEIDNIEGEEALLEEVFIAVKPTTNLHQTRKQPKTSATGGHE